VIWNTHSWNLFTLLKFIPETFQCEPSLNIVNEKTEGVGTAGRLVLGTRDTALQLEAQQEFNFLRAEK
jgi:hypothetical protein